MGKALKCWNGGYSASARQATSSNSRCTVSGDAKAPPTGGPCLLAGKETLIVGAP
jgi:hypothetical protein